MESKENDIAVLLIFFSRPEQFKKVFEQVRIAKPKILLLYQDGARKGNEKDKAGIAACRKIAENIDWNCEVHRKYQEKNFGCDPSEYLAQKWAFSIVKKCIILEDDDVPVQKFFAFCREMLDQYENDERINIISGQNVLEKYSPDGNDYFFSRICAIWGWASWRRVVEKWDPSYRFLDNAESVARLQRRYSGNRHFRMTMETARKHKATGIAYYETLVSTTMYLTDAVNIVPAENLITNIGIAAESTHSTSDIRTLPHGIRRVFNMPAYDDPKDRFNGPAEVKETREYRERVCRVMAWGHPFVRAWRIFESIVLVTIYGGFGAAMSKIKKRLYIR